MTLADIIERITPRRPKNYASRQAPTGSPDQTSRQPGTT